MTRMPEPGDRLGLDETAHPPITWLAYADAGQMWAACYVAGSLLQEFPDGWYRRDARHSKVAVDAETLERARACMPDQPPVWPPQDGLGPPGAGARVNGARMSHRAASMVTVVPPVWLWERWLVAGVVQLLVGRQGTGKSTFASWVVSQLSTGRPWPGEIEHRPPRRCGMLSLEEPADRLVARLIAAGGDLDAVEILGEVEDHDDDGRPYRRPWHLPGDCAALETTIREVGLQVVTIDGLGYAISGDSHNYANVGSALSALAGVAERTGSAILGLTHPPKGNSDAVTAAIGSTAWTALARISWVMGVDPGDDSGSRRVVRPAPGSNYRLPDHGLSFVIANHDETEAGFVTGLQSSDVDPQMITSPPAGDTSEERSKFQMAKDLLTDRLATCDHLSKELISAAREGYDISEKTLRRAGVDLEVAAYQMGREWWWRLPSDGQMVSDGKRPSEP
jgi:putative DNA primase/helicase